MNGTELRSFGHFYKFGPKLHTRTNRNLENLPILKFVFIYCKTVKVIQYDLIRL